jgi:hypothetical protein
MFCRWQKKLGDCMHRDHKIFIQAIKSRKKILIQHHSENSRHANTKVYCPLFYIPSSEKDNSGSYYFWEGEKAFKGNIISVKADKIVRFGQTQEPFDPAGLSLFSNEDVLQ